jgi:hypothetical protein
MAEWRMRQWKGGHRFGDASTLYIHEADSRLILAIVTRRANGWMADVCHVQSAGMVDPFQRKSVSVGLSKRLARRLSDKRGQRQRRGFGGVVRSAVKEVAVERPLIHLIGSRRPFLRHSHGLCEAYIILFIRLASDPRGAFHPQRPKSHRRM